MTTSENPLSSPPRALGASRGREGTASTAAEKEAQAWRVGDAGRGPRGWGREREPEGDESGELAQVFPPWEGAWVLFYSKWPHTGHPRHLQRLLEEAVESSRGG